ncbi:MAG: hypothetical protein C4321_02775, partial [Chloroflexota bacterium]
SLWKNAICERLDLQPLSERETSGLLRQVLGAPLDELDVHALWRATQGNLLFLREVVNEGVQRGMLVKSKGRWRWHGEVRASARVVELIAAQLDALDQQLLDALRVSALGEPLEWDVLVALAPGAQRAIDRGLLIVEETGGTDYVRLWHPLVGDVVQRGMAR